MAARSKNLSPRLRSMMIRHFPAWVLLGAILILILPQLLNFLLHLSVKAITGAPGFMLDVGEGLVHLGLDGGELVINGVVDGVEAGAAVAGNALEDLGDTIGDLLARPSQPAASGLIASLFTPEVEYWAADIQRWATEHNLDPNLLATVMQIESCGHPTVNSHAGAQGLFQVMPFHFAPTEDMLDPDTNAFRGADFLNLCLDMANGDAGLAMACYNGGPSVLRTSQANWLDEPRRYYYWGTGIYADALQNGESSTRLTEWLNAGGQRLCDMASGELGLE